MKRKLTLLLVFVLLLALLCGCDSKRAADDTAFAAGANAKPEVPKSENASYAEMEAAANAPAELPPSAAAPEAPAVGVQGNVKIIYTADINLESTAFDETVRGLNALAASVGGYFEYSNLENYSSDYRTGNYTVRVPQANFEAFCSGVGGLGQVNSISRNAEDISEAYYDVESRLATQKTKMERLQTLLAKAENMEDIISLEYAISDTELTIEQLTGSLRKYDSLVDYATVRIYLREVYRLTEQEQPVIGFGAKLAEAFRTGSSGFVYDVQSLLLSVARNWVGSLIFLVIVGAVITVPVRICRRKKAARRAAEQSEEE